MDFTGCSRRWRTRIPEFIRSGTGQTTIQNLEDRERTHDKERAGARKSVTMAPTSRYMTDRRQYVMRRPLSATEHQTSILKKSHEHSDKEKQRQCSVTEEHNDNLHLHTETDFHAKQAEEEIPDLSLDRFHMDMSPISPSGEHLSTPLDVADQRRWYSQEEPVFGSPCQGSRLSPRSLSSPPLEVRQFSSPLSPKWNSTLLSPPSCSPSFRPSRSRQTELRLGGGRETRFKAASSLGYSKSYIPPALHNMPPHQANYWACAIPTSMPPSPDRGSPAWDPDKEYQALLDYTYPLRPGRVVSSWETSELEGVSLLQRNPGLQDSGIELDGLCSSTSLSAIDFPLSGALGVGTVWAREKGMLGPDQRLSEPRGLSHSKFSNGILSSSPYSSAEGLSLESLHCSKERTGLNQAACSGGGQYRQTGVLSTSSGFIRSTSVLPRLSGLKGEAWDEEFWPLPERLEELQVLSRQVREVTAQLSQPVTASWESLERGTMSLHSSTTLPDKQEDEEQDKKEARDNKDIDGSEELRRKEVHGDSLQAIQATASSLDHPGKGVRANLREVEAVVEQLVGLTLPEIQRSQRENQQANSLVKHIKTFCTNLEDLIQWLYTVVEKMEVLAPPRVDIDSVKSSLAEYKSFQRDVSAHQSLTTSVLQTGELLLNCMTSTSPVLKDTLTLIERQSQALEMHTEHLFSSILSAMDSLTQPSQPVQSSQPGDPQPRGNEA
ncbi:centrosomal protein of 68 kDa isoform X1 [Hypomesus transpacificus]|uniref:centrosomal protein of 68 kDa isoform X1 n=2 Tax=Hypomesus transpacificus TaxID=137520 RepID=UPI001F078451|nr:centrosomal protein of 68 kDa isoform X1 [Hypomesus transpacificus]XP_046886266.1 centrosomal protein of 68 kDa isoform X1 [Hypomesus transpacificus]